jgi:hypothetical protein
MNKLAFIKALWSPFKPFKLKWYCGKTAIGTPYFYPRRWVKDLEKPGYQKAISKKIGFDFIGLGWKTKWSNTDYRFEWYPLLSFVFFGYQIAVIVNAPHSSNYWESWLYYERDTDKSKSKKERIEQCKLEFSQKYTSHYSDGKKEIIDYYKLILKKKYLWTQ